MYASRAVCGVPVVQDPTVKSTKPQNGPGVLSLSHSGSGIVRIQTAAQEMNKKHGSTGFISKIFSKKEKENKGVSDDVLQEYELMAKKEDQLKGLIQPCPFIRPLQNKPEARVEKKPFGKSARAKPGFAQPAANGSQLSDSIYKSHTQRTISSYVTDSECGHTLEDDSTADISVAQDDGNYQIDHYGQEERTESSAGAVRHFMDDQIDYATSLATQDPDLVEHWRCWLLNYATVSISFVNTVPK
jgi:hypothetical protein